MNLKVLIIFYTIGSAQSLAATYFRVEEKLGNKLTGCYQRLCLKPYPKYEKIDDPKYFLMHNGKCWIFSSDNNGSDVKYQLR